MDEAIKGFSWVLPGELAGMGLPGVWNPEEDLAFLKEQGVGAVVSLTETPPDEQGIREAGMAFLHLPTVDMTPPAQGDIARFVWFAEARIAEGRPVVVHCLAGRGRTGTMLACLLVARGASADEAIGRIRELRPGSIETEAQASAVRTYAQGLENG